MLKIVASYQEKQVPSEWLSDFGCVYFAICQNTQNKRLLALCLKFNYIFATLCRHFWRRSGIKNIIIFIRP